MNRRSLLILSGVAAAAIGGALLLTPRGTESPLPGTGAQGGGLAFPGLAGRLAGAERIEVKKPDSTLVLVREGDRWLVPEKGGYPARPERVRELLVGLTELRLAERRTADPNQLERLGVDDPARTGSSALLLRVLDAQGTPIAELVVGRRRVRTQGSVPESVYVRRPNETQSWLAEGRLAVDADPQLWLDRDIVNLPAERVRRLEARRREPAETMVLAREEWGEAKLAVLEPANPPPLDAIALDEVLRAFEFLTFLDVRRATEIPGTPVGEGRFGLTGGLTVVVRPNRDGEALWILLQAEGSTPEAERLNARWSGWAYQVGPWKEKAFVPGIAELTDRQAAAAAAGRAPAADEVSPADPPAAPRP